AAAYALQSYAQMLAEAEAADDKDVQEDRDRMLDLARYMEERWPNELAGNLARHQIGLRLAREGKTTEAVLKLSAVTPAYPSYAFAQYQLADAAFKADKDGLDPLPGDQPGAYRRRALEALERIPDSTLGADPATNHIYMAAKARLGRELFKAKKFDEMRKLAETLLARLPGVTLNADPKRDEAVRDQIKTELTDLQLFAAYGLADVQFTKANYAEVAKVLDPVVQK